MVKYAFILFVVAALYSCNEKAYVKIENRVHNAALKNISWENHAVTEILFSGETSDELLIVDRKEEFPKKGVVKFYMERNRQRIYLETKYEFLLDAGQNLMIIISDTTAVVNPVDEDGVLRDQGKTSGQVDE